MRTKEEEIERIEALIVRTADWIIQARDKDDSEGVEASWLYLNQLKEQKKLLENE